MTEPHDSNPFVQGTTAGPEVSESSSGRWHPGRFDTGPG